nr:hypothetical protein FVER53263_11046 [Fusarium verticillioides]
MATNQQTSFERSLDLFRRELSDDQIKRVNGVNQKTVTDTIQEIQGKLGRRDGLCKLTRIQRFLQAMEHIEKLVTIFLNASDFVAFIWGPIKLALMVATTWTEAIRQLIDAYEEIADALGNLAFFHNLIQSRDHLKLVLDDYFSDILRFHRCVLDVFSRPDDKLQSHAILKEVQDSDQYAKDQFSNLQTSLDDIRSTLASEQLQSKALQSREMKTYLESRLDVSTSRTDLQLESQDTVDENSGIWIFSNPIFNGWEGGKSAEKRVLFLNGSPGSGKSTLAKTIIRHQRQKEASEAPGRSFLAYFFFKHNVADQRTARSMLQHVIMQLVDADETTLRYLIRNRTINLLEEHIDMALFCCQYLSSRPFTTSKSQDISADIHSGYFGFLDYAAAHYAAHVHEVAAPHVSTDSVSNLEPVKESVKTAAFDLAKAHGKEASVETGEIAKAAENLHLAIQDNVLVVRNLISLQREKSETDVFGATEGPIRHKCPKIKCAKFSTGCPNKAALKEHLAVHERPFRCPHSDCFGHRIGYPSSERLESHNEAFHQSESRVKTVFPSDLQTGEWNIHEACKAGNLDEVKRFRCEGSDLKRVLPKIGSPLCAAVEAGHGGICQYLVDNGVDPFRWGSNTVAMKTPVVAAIYRQRWEILDFFLCSGNGPDDSELLKDSPKTM